MMTAVKEAEAAVEAVYMDEEVVMMAVEVVADMVAVDATVADVHTEEEAVTEGAAEATNRICPMWTYHASQAIWT